MNYSLIKPTQAMKSTIVSMNTKDYLCVSGLPLKSIFENFPNKFLFLHLQQPGCEDI